MIQVTDRKLRKRYLIGFGLFVAAIVAGLFYYRPWISRPDETFSEFLPSSNGCLNVRKLRSTRKEIVLEDSSEFRKRLSQELERSYFWKSYTSAEGSFVIGGAGTTFQVQDCVNDGQGSVLFITPSALLLHRNGVFVYSVRVDSSSLYDYLGPLVTPNATE